MKVCHNSDPSFNFHLNVLLPPNKAQNRVTSLTLQFSLPDTAHQLSQLVEHREALVLVVGDHEVALGGAGNAAGPLHLTRAAAAHPEPSGHTRSGQVRSQADQLRARRV